MAVVSDQTIASAAAAAGFPRDELATAVAVALAESGGNAAAHNDDEPDGSESFGLWQINSVHRADLAAGNWQDPVDNARMAFAVWSRAGRQWSPWTTWRNGAHLPFLARGEAAARQVEEGGVVLAANPLVPDALEDMAGSIGDAFDVLTDRDLWVRIGIGAVGVLIVVVGLVGLLWTLGAKKKLDQAVQLIGGATVGKAGKAAKAVAATSAAAGADQ